MRFDLSVRDRKSAVQGVLLALSIAVSLTACGGYSGAPDSSGSGESDGGGNGSDPGSGSGGDDGGSSGDGGGSATGTDLAKGADEYDAQCKSCHGSDGGGGIGPDLTSTSTCPTCTDQATLASYIDAEMPDSNPGACVDDCAADVAAYILNGFSTTPSEGGGGSSGSGGDSGGGGEDPGSGSGGGSDPGSGSGSGDSGGDTETGNPCGTSADPDPEPEPEPEVTPTCSVEAFYSSSWNTGFVYNVKLKNFSGAPVSNWKVTWTFPNDQQVTNAWNTKLSANGRAYTALPESYNGTINNDSTVEFGMQGTHGGVNNLPTDVVFEAPGCIVASPASGGGGSGGSGSTGDGDEGGCEEPLPAEETPACPTAAAPRLLRLLNRWEYNRTVEDLVGITGDFAANLPLEARVGGYDNNARVALVTDRHVDEYVAAAQTIAQRAVSERRSALLPCNPSSDKTGCTRSFVSSFGKRAFRRPLSSAEIDQYSGLMSDSLTGGDFDSGMELIITAMLSSPNFLYRSESGSVADDEYRLGGYEAASSLSYLFWGSMPDDALFSAADDGSLATADGRETQARRLMADERAREQMGHFATEWLGTHYLVESFKDPEIFPRLTTAVRESMAQELSLFINNLVFGGGKFAELYNANYAYVNGPLREYYGMTGSTTDSNFVKQTVTDGTRGGLIPMGAIMASYAHSNESSPIKRGVFVRERLLCQDLPDPPANVDTTPPGLDPSKTTRERFAAHTADPACSSCHSFIDGIGFGLERYDGAGGYRAVENGQTVDDSGELKGPEGFSDSTVQPFHGAKELAALVANTQAARDCMVLQYYRYGRGYLEDENFDQCTIDELQQRFADSNGDLQSLLLDYVRDDSFVRRHAE